MDEVHGREIHDPYRWLENDDSRTVAAWVDAQDAHARAVLAASPHQAGFRRALRRMWDREAVVGPVHKRGNRYFYARRHRGRDKPVYYVREGLEGRERVLIDPRGLSEDGSLGVRSIHPSLDGKHVAYAISRNNADAATLYVRRVADGKDLSRDVIPGARFASPQWTPDSRSFYYTGLPDDPTIPPSKLAGHATIRLHQLGTSPEDDEVMFGPTGDARTFIVGHLSTDARYLLVHLFRGSSATSDVYFKDLRRGGPLVPLVVGNGESNMAYGYRGRFYLYTSEGAPRFRLLEIDPERPGRGDWREVVPQRKQTLEDVAFMDRHLVLSYLDDVNGRVVVHRLRDDREWEVDLPERGAVLGVWTDPSVKEALIGFGSLEQRPAVYRVPLPADASAMAQPGVFWAPQDDGDTDDLVMRQVMVPSRDGTRVPVSILHHRDLRLDGSNPTILYGYGGFGISIKPGYNPLAALWARRGGVWAQASLRGGGEYGEEWHRAGKRHRKQNVFDDFLASAEFLVDAGYARPERLGIMGGSNGGLLVGAASTQRPDLFGAVVCQVPLLDMVRYDRFGLGELWIDEYGSPADPEDFAALHAYSPYHAIREGTEYPALLMMSADTDDRVHPLHARKYVAAMQHANGAKNPTLLRTEERAGHGGADSLTQQIESFADVLAFMLGQLVPDYGRG